MGSQGEELQVVGVYAVVGASLASFEREESRLACEGRLVAFVQSQKRKAEERGCAVVLAGNLNSVGQVAVDTWGGTYVSREGCLARALQEDGWEDTFRARHRTLCRFTYFSAAATASRLDGLWTYRPGVAVRTVNAALLWGWERRADHEPAVTDLTFELPTLQEAQQEPGFPGQEIVSKIRGGEFGHLSSQVQEAVAARRQQFDRAEVELNNLRRECNVGGLFPGP